MMLIYDSKLSALLSYYLIEVAKDKKLARKTVTFKRKDEHGSFFKIDFYFQAIHLNTFTLPFKKNT